MERYSLEKAQAEASELRQSVRLDIMDKEGKFLDPVSADKLSTGDVSGKGAGKEGDFPAGTEVSEPTPEEEAEEWDFTPVGTFVGPSLDEIPIPKRKSKRKT